jgi:hypothetical protein
MKVQLERKSATCPSQLLCTVCGQMFVAGAIRTLLYSHHHLLQGDVCPECMHLGSARFRQKLHDRASLLLKLSQIDEQMRIAQRQRALELIDLAREAVQFPAPYQWWWKRLALLSEESADLDIPTSGLDRRYGEERSRLDRLLEHDHGLN